MTQSDSPEWLLIIDASLNARMAPELRNKRKRMSLSCRDLSIQHFLDPSLLRFLHLYWPLAVLVTADDHMPEVHGHLIERWNQTVAVIDPRTPAVYWGDDSWHWEILHRWAHHMQAQPQGTVYRYNARGRRPWTRPRTTKVAKRLTMSSLSEVPPEDFDLHADVSLEGHGDQLAFEEE